MGRPSRTGSKGVVARKMATGIFYRIIYRGPNGERVFERAGTNKTAAAAMLVERKAAVKRGDWQPLPQGKSLPMNSPTRRAARPSDTAKQAWRAAKDIYDPKWRRRAHLWRDHKVTLEWYDAALAQQGGACAICRKPPRGRLPLVVDHDHATERRRGLLCTPCNLRVAAFESPLTVATREYIARHATQEAAE